jgi:hypothetical protein
MDRSSFDGSAKWMVSLALGEHARHLADDVRVVLVAQQD